MSVGLGVTFGENRRRAFVAVQCFVLHGAIDGERQLQRQTHKFDTVVGHIEQLPES
jgi:hypothetical protein